MSVEKSRKIITSYVWSGEVPRKKGGIRKMRTGEILIRTKFFETEKSHSILFFDTEKEITSGKQQARGAGWLMAAVCRGRFDMGRGKHENEATISDYRIDPEDVIAFFGHLADILCERGAGPMDTKKEDADEAWRRMTATRERDEIDTPDVKAGTGGKVGKPRV